MDSVARTEEAGKAASPTNRPARSFPNAKSFVQVTYAQLSIDDDRLSRAKKLLLVALGFWSWDGEPCWPSNDELAQAMGLTGAHRARSVRYLIQGRKVRGKKCPGLLEDGWMEIRPDDNPTGRLIAPTPKWVEFARVKIFNKGHAPSEGGGRAPLPPRGARPPPPGARALPPPGRAPPRIRLT